MNRSFGLFALVLLIACGDDDTTPPVMDGGSECAVECDDGLFCTGAEFCDPSDPVADENGCVTQPPPCRRRAEVCSELRDECITCDSANPSTGWDVDGDGSISMDCGGPDCNDDNPNQAPGLMEVCDAEGIDEDCDPTTVGTPANDRDGDGEVSSVCCNLDAEGALSCGLDCNDLDGDVNSSGEEVCNGLDDDCDGMVDETVLVEGYADTDGDLHGDPDAAMMGCEGTSGFSLLDDDCDDDDRLRHGDMPEVCDEVDNDCDDEVDEARVIITWYRDEDNDGFGTATTTMLACEPPEGFSPLWTDCNDSNPDVHPLAEEICDGLDNNCNGLADFTTPEGGLEDNDRDGVPDCDGEMPSDCDDLNWDVHGAFDGRIEAATEYCDEIDNDCDGELDEGADEVEETFFRDMDGDTWGTADSPSEVMCAPEAGFVTRIGDCDDENPDVHPTRVDVCDGENQDCDFSIDENAPNRAYYNDVDGDGARGGMQLLACEQPEEGGFTPDASDCNDDDGGIPADAETCGNGEDEDCDGLSDEGCP
ncbi:MAG: putative metal-binding motif-containing protein [Myxococcota bacterium]